MTVLHRGDGEGRCNAGPRDFPSHGYRGGDNGFNSSSKTRKGSDLLVVYGIVLHYIGISLDVGGGSIVCGGVVGCVMETAGDYVCWMFA